MAVNFKTQIPTNGLLLLLDTANVKSYPGSGSTWYDLSGNGNHFTLNGSLTFNPISGFSGFTQANRWYKNSFPTNLKNAQGGSGLTTVVWAKCNGVSGLWQKLLGNGDDQNYIDIYASSSGGFYHCEDGSTLYYDSGTNVSTTTYFLGDGVWRQLISTNLNNGLTTNPTDAFGIGSEGDTQFNYPWNGNIAVVIMYNRVITSAEMQQLFNAYRGRFGR